MFLMQILMMVMDFYSGGGYEGPDGLANGLTSFREAMVVAEDFGQDVRINFDGSLSDLTTQLDVSLASPIFAYYLLSTVVDIQLMEVD